MDAGGIDDAARPMPGMPRACAPSLHPRRGMQGKSPCPSNARLPLSDDVPTQQSPQGPRLIGRQSLTNRAWRGAVHPIDRPCKGLPAFSKLSPLGLPGSNCQPDQLLEPWLLG